MKLCRLRNGADCQMRCAREHAPPNRTIRPAADCKVENQVGDAATPRRGANDAIDATRIREEIPLDQHGIAELWADLPRAGAAIRRRQIRILCATLDDRARGQIAGHHRVINPLCRECVHEAAGVAGEKNAPAAGPAKRATDWNLKWREVTPYRLAGDDAARSQRVDEPTLQLVRRGVDRLPIMRQHIADADVDVITFWKDVGVAGP